MKSVTFNRIKVTLLLFLKDKKLGVYLRKESVDENITTGYGRLQWLKYEIEDYKGDRKIFIDELNENSNLLCMINDVKSGELEAIIIWTLSDIDLDMIISFWVTCFMNGIPVIRIKVYIINWIRGRQKLEEYKDGF